MNTNISKQQQTNQQTTGYGEYSQQSSNNESQKSRDKNMISDNSDAKRFTFPDEAPPITLNGKINGFADKIKYIFDAKKDQKLTASVKPQGSTGNIRISQIISPSKKQTDHLTIKSIIHLLKTEITYWY